MPLSDPKFRFTVMWEQSPDVRHGAKPGPDVTYAATQTFDVLTAAMDAHHIACRGGWVEPGMRRPQVGPLEIVRDGHIIGVRLEGRDLDEAPLPTSEMAHR